jgi:hypothetical protein
MPPHWATVSAVAQQFDELAPGALDELDEPGELLHAAHKSAVATTSPKEYRLIDVFFWKPALFWQAVPSGKGADRCLRRNDTKLFFILLTQTSKSSNDIVP